MEANEKPPKKFDSDKQSPAWVPVSMAVLAIGLFLLAFVQFQIQQDHQKFRDLVTSQGQRSTDRITRLEEQASALEDSASRLGEQAASISKGLEGARRNMVSSSTQLKDQQQAAKKMRVLVDEQKGLVDSLSGEVQSVKGGLGEANGKLDSQGGLIARNHDELQDLKRRGERSFVEFNLRKEKRPTRVGDISLQLTKADPKRQKYSLVVLANDKRIEKKDKTALEPLQFYMSKDHRLLEVVVWDVNPNQVVGYVSVPKGS